MEFPRLIECTSSLWSCQLCSTVHSTSIHTTHTDLSLMQGEKDGLLFLVGLLSFPFFFVYIFYTGHLLPLHLSPSVFCDSCMCVHAHVLLQAQFISRQWLCTQSKNK